MVKVVHYSAAPAGDADAASAFDFAAGSALLDAVLLAQRQQWEAMLAWQQSLAEWQQDAWDQWVSHWAGGVPIDA